MKILVTGFEPFGGEAVNPSLLAVERLGNEIAGAKIEKRPLPVSFRAAGEAVRAALVALRPDALVLVGQAGGRASVSVERVAINLNDARIPDNAGDQPVDRPIRAGGPAAYFATLPVRRMVQSILSVGVPAEISLSAGAYVCNHALYCALNAIEEYGLQTRAGFIHVPYLPGQAAAKGAPSLPLGEIVRALEAAVQAIVKWEESVWNLCESTN